VYAAGAHATPGGGLPFVGLSASLVAQAIGPA
jgi:UDP-galactopyranose mutase